MILLPTKITHSLLQPTSWSVGSTIQCEHDFFQYRLVRQKDKWTWWQHLYSKGLSRRWLNQQLRPMADGRSRPAGRKSGRVIFAGIIYIRTLSSSATLVIKKCRCLHNITSTYLIYYFCFKSSYCLTIS